MEEKTMKLLGLGHVALMIRDIEPAMDFYCGKLGFDISASSEPGVGTVIRLNLEQKQSVYE